MVEQVWDGSIETWIGEGVNVVTAGCRITGTLCCGLKMTRTTIIMYFVKWNAMRCAPTWSTERKIGDGPVCGGVRAAMLNSHSASMLALH